MGVKAKMRCYGTLRGGGLAECSGRPIFICFIKENWICAMIRYHDEPNNLLLTRNRPFEPDVRQWSYPLMIPLHCLWDKSNNTTYCQFVCDVIWFCFCFNFVRLFTSKVCLLFHSLFTFSNYAKRKNMLIEKSVPKMWIII